MKTKTNKKTGPKGNVGKKIVIGAGVAVASALAYEFLGPKGKKNRKVVKSWAVNLEKEMVKKFENAKDQSLPAYHKILDQAKEKYENLKNVDKKDLDLVVADIRKHWKNLSGKKPTKESKTTVKSKK